jgi:hypothetical protein
MSVLACTIGALTLLLASLSISAVAPRDREPAVRVGSATSESGTSRSSSRGPRPPSANRPSHAPSNELESIESLEALWAEVDRVLAARGDTAGVTLQALESQVASRRQGRQLEADLERLKAEARKVESERESVEASIAVLESRRETLPILIDPTGLSRHLEPWFVETDARGVTAYRASDGYGHFVSGDELGPEGDFGRYLRRLRAIPGALLVLLVRPDGLRTAESAARIADAAGVRVARLPLPGRGPLDWALLRRAEEGSAE